MTEQAYRAHPAVSRSDLWLLARSPAHYQWAKQHPSPPTPALLLGQAVHMAILQPELYAQSYAVGPSADRRTKEGRALAESLSEDGRQRLAPGDAALVEGVRDAVLADAACARLLDGPHETPHFWTDAATGEACKCRTDAEADLAGRLVVADVKTCRSAATEDFQREAVRLGYDLQAAMYTAGVRAATGRDCAFVFIAVEKEPPYALNVLQADPLLLTRGRDLLRELLGRYHECRQSGRWYGYNGFSGLVGTLGLPAWLAKDYE